MDALQVDITLPRRDFALDLALGVGRETVALVGPSGSGKTSVLRAIAGLERPVRGRVVADGRVLFDAERRVDVPVEERRVGYLFQGDALFPHMTVAQNVAFARRRPRPDLLERLGIAHLADARPGEISGGERQRAALARALACDPAVLLLDEPMSALDERTRATVRAELARTLADLRLPTLLVTHDFTDAMTLARRVGVVDRGRLVQVGEPADLLAAPSDAVVASLTGANVLSGTASAGADGLTRVALDDGGLAWSVDPADGPVDVVIQPWEISIARTPPDDSTRNHLLGPVGSVARLGNRVRVQVGPLVAEITAASADAIGVRVGDSVVASFKAAATRLVPRAAPALSRPGEAPGSAPGEGS